MNINYQKWVIYSALCIALNVGLGKVSNLLALPFTMDTIGTIIGATILPWYLTIVVASVSSIVASILINPVFIYYIGTQVVIALASLLFVKLKMFSSLPKAVVSGICIGICSAIASAPVTAIVFGGVAVPSITALNALFLASGASLWTSVVSGALIVESIDKLVASIIAWNTIKRVSKDI